MHDFGANLDSFVENGSGFRESVLHCAVKGNHTSTVALLVDELEVKTNGVTSSDGETPFHAAARVGNDEIIKVSVPGYRARGHARLTY